MPTDGIVKDFKIEKNRDADKKTIMLQVELDDTDDVQSVELINASGVDYNPPSGSQVIILDLGPAWKVAIASDDNVEPDTDPGDYEIYSSDAAGEAKLSFVKCTRDGVKKLVKINGDADFAVRFNELETAFNQLKSDYDAHTHQYTTPLHPSTPGPTGTPPASTADISPAKVEDVLLTGATP
jgi:hypothetical protein